MVTVKYSLCVPNKTQLFLLSDRKVSNYVGPAQCQGSVTDGIKLTGGIGNEELRKAKVRSSLAYFKETAEQLT